MLHQPSGVAAEATSRNAIRGGLSLRSRGATRAGAAVAERAFSVANDWCRSRRGHSMWPQRSNMALQLTRPAQPNEQREAAGSGPRS